MKTRKIILTGILMSIVFQSIANEPDSANATAADSVRPFQVTFITPFGTNGYLSTTSVNNISLNIIAGYNGGLQGIEVGGVANVLQHYMEGIQCAGFANLVAGNMQGIQTAGFANLVGGSSDGFMVSGFTNHAAKGGQLVQIAGFSNQAMGTFTGAQVAGFGNLVTDSAEGVQVAGFANFAGAGSDVTQVAGFMNSARGSVTGGQAAGFLNQAYDIDGIQASGFLNIARNVHGVQIGFINVADSFSAGVPIGFLSLVKNGHRQLLLQANELQWGEVQLHTGVAKLYNVFAASLKPMGDQPGWAFGYGLGTTLLNRDVSDIRMEAVVYHINEGEFWTSALNNLVRITARYEFHPKGNGFGISAGPSLNFHTSSKSDFYGDPFHSKTPPYSILSDEGLALTRNFWVGGQLGVTF